MTEDIKPLLTELSNRVFALELTLESRNQGRNLFKEQAVQFFCRGIASPLFQRYVHYALESLNRGQKVVRQHLHDAQVTRSFLDIGCAYGGSVTAMALAGVQRCIGIDVTDRYLGLAWQLARENGVEKKVDFLVADLTDLDSLKVEKFDMVMCTDVIEHVSDPAVAIKNLSALTNAKGSLIFDVPNMLCIDLVYRDPHHQLFGSVLLPKDRALAVFQEHFPRNPIYTVGHFRPLEWYLESLEQCGFTVEILDNMSEANQAIPKIEERIKDLQQAFETISDQEKWSDLRKSWISEAISDYLRQCEQDFSSGTMSNEDLFRRYGIQTYHLRCLKR